jgi:hypothetical protein
MIPHQFFYLMVVLGLLWIFFMLHLAWPSPCPATPQRPAEPSLPRRPRSSEPKAFTGLTHKPQCVACEQAPPAPPGHCPCCATATDHLHPWPQAPGGHQAPFLRV